MAETPLEKRRRRLKQLKKLVDSVGEIEVGSLRGRFAYETGLRGATIMEMIRDLKDAGFIIMEHGKIKSIDKFGEDKI